MRAIFFAILGFAALGTVSSSAQDYIPYRDRQPQQPQPMRLEASPTIPASFFAGSWGQVSFNNESDIPKMRGIARQYCGPLAVPIRTNSPTTFMMYVTTELKEVQVYDQGGQQFIIPVAQQSDGVVREARALHVVDNNAFTLHYLDENAQSRYGDNLFVRCGSRDETAPSPKSKKAKPAKRRARHH